MLIRLVLCVALALSSTSSLAQQGEQIDEELRALLLETVANADSFEDRFDAEVWLMQKDGVLKKFVKDAEYRLFLLKEVHKAATQADLPPEFVLAVIHVESYFDRYAVSSVGAQGLMQVMPFWKKEIGRENDNLIDPVTNLRYGCTILKYYLEKSDNNWAEALARYNGSYGKLWYPMRVMDRWDDYWR